MPNPGAAEKRYEQQLGEQQQALQEAIDQLERERARKLDGLEEPTGPDQQKRQQQSEQLADALNRSEAQTRAQMIDALLLQAGWDINDPDQVAREVPVVRADAPSGQGRADYVLWGDNGEPLAVIEAKKTSRSEQESREQARLYADGLEQMGRQRPVIF